MLSNRWERKGGDVAMWLVVPPNCTADVILPAAAGNIRYQGGFISSLKTLGSGIHEITWKETR
jgi:hypothetical protein